MPSSANVKSTTFCTVTESSASNSVRPDTKTSTPCLGERHQKNQHAGAGDAGQETKNNWVPRQGAKTKANIYKHIASRKMIMFDRKERIYQGESVSRTGFKKKARLSEGTNDGRGPQLCSARGNHANVQLH